MRISTRGPGPGPGPWALARARPSVDMNWPLSDLLADVADVVLTSVGGLGVKGRGEGVVWGSLYVRARRVEILKN